MTLTPDFSFTESPDGIPDDSPVPFEVASNDPLCKVCGTPLLYSGRGRKPEYCDEHKKAKSTPRAATSSKGSTRDVTAAQNALKTLNGLLSVPLMFAAPNAAGMWGQGRPALEEQTLAILEADPVLAKRLAAMGGKGGVLSLAIAYGTALIPVMGMARYEMAMRADAREVNDE